METDRLEYLDRDDVRTSSEAQRGPRSGAHRTGFRKARDVRAHRAREVADVADPKILELGAGHGGLSRKLLEMHPTARLTVTDVEPSSVAAIAAGELGDHPRATVREMDATAIDARRRQHYDLAVFALSFHHLPPAAAARVFAEGTRVADKLVIIDLPRPPSLLHLVQLAPDAAVGRASRSCMTA